MQQQRIKQVTKGGYQNFNQSITGIKTVTELKPALQVKQNSRLMGKGSLYGTNAIPAKLPPMKLDSLRKQDFDNSPDKSFDIMQDQYGYEDLNVSSFSAVPSNYILFSLLILF